MDTFVGIVSEYNPFHRGHQKQIHWIREKFGKNTAIVAVMSGNFVQRGQPAIFDKWARSRVAVSCGVNLVVELPVTKALSSAEGFAHGAVEILHKMGAVTHLCFGSESGDLASIQTTADLLLRPEFDGLIHEKLRAGVSYATARGQVLEALGGEDVSRPNDILAVEYCKALRRLNSAIQPVTLVREGCYHAEAPDLDNPSATSIRRLIGQNQAWQDYVPQPELLEGATVYLPQAGERAVLAKLASMTSRDFANLPYGSEGLHYKLEKACKNSSSVLEILEKTKSKRYAWSRLTRMVACAYLGIDQAMLNVEIPYVRALAFDGVGRKLLKTARVVGDIPIVNGGETPPEPSYWQLEQRASDLHSLFSAEKPPMFGGESKGRSFVAP